MKLSIIIVSYNVKYYLEQCLNSIFASHIGFEYEVIIIDNNSSDSSVEYIKEKFRDPSIMIIANDENVGFSKANNVAIDIAKGEYILLLNPDTVLGENVLTNTCSFLDKNSDAGALSVKMINGSGEFLAESKRGFPTPWASFCKLSGLASLFPTSSFFGQYSLKYLNENQIHKVPILVGAYMLIRKKALNKSGLFDENYFMYGEDIDLSYRLLRSGFTNYYVPEKIIHYKGESTDKNDKKYTEAFYGAMRIFFKKFYPNSNWLFSLFITIGINIKAFMSYRCIKKNPIKKESKIRVFNIQETNYETLIEEMDRNTDPNIMFRIYNPVTGITIGSQFAEKN